MAGTLSSFRGFDIVRVEVRLKPYSVDYDGRIRPHDFDQQDREIEECMQLIEARLSAALGAATWERKNPGNCYEEVLVAEFRPWLSKQ